MSIRNLIMIGAVCVIAITAACSKKMPGDNKMNPNMRQDAQVVSVQSPAIADLKNYLSYSVPLKALRDVLVFASDSQRVKQILKKEGDWVTQGESLARLDDEEMTLVFQKMKASYVKAKNNYERTKQLFESNMVSSENFENARLDFESIEADFKLQEKRVRDLNVISPITGVVGRKFIEDEEMVSVNQKLYRVVDTTTLKAEINLPEKEFNFVKRGNRVEVSPSEGKIIFGTINSISPIIDETTGTFNVEVYVRGSKELIPGMFVKMNIITREKKNCLTIPAKAIVTVDGKKGVYVIVDGKAVFKEITTGILDGNSIEVEKGLLPEERVIITGQNSIKNNDPVRVAGEEQKTDKKPDDEKKLSKKDGTKK